MLGIIIVVAGVGCSEAAPRRSATSFAERYAAVESPEFDGSDLGEVVERADDVIVGALTSVVRGPDVVAAESSDIAPLATTAILTIENEDGLHRVAVPRRPNDDIEDMAARAPIGARVVAMTVPMTVDDGTALDGAYADPDAVAEMVSLVHPVGLLVVEDGVVRPMFGSSTEIAPTRSNLDVLTALGVAAERIG